MSVRLSLHLARLRLNIPLVRLGWRFLDDGDAWRSLPWGIPHELYGAGSTHPFGWYLEGESTVPAASLTDICAWLRGCEYRRDPELFNLPDFWQHPRTFESLKKGDCEDHALWAWRKLRDLGVPAELVVGQWHARENETPGHHAWVVVQIDGVAHLLETVCKDEHDMLVPLEAVRTKYLPHMSIDVELRGRVYAGLFKWLGDERDRRRARRGRKSSPDTAVSTP